MVNNEMNSENLNNDSTKVAWKDQESEGNNTELPSNVDSSVPNNKLSDSLKSTIRKSVDFPIYEVRYSDKSLCCVFAGAILF
jgi:hypothetical protein